MLQDQHLHVSEDFSQLEEPSLRDAKFDVVQFETKAFEFWSQEKVTRSINRFLSTFDNVVDQSCDVEDHPLEKSTKVTSYAGADPDNVIDFPGVFEFRLYGEKSVNTLQEWECVVEEVEGDVVIANAISLMDRDPDKNLLKIPISEFAPSDRALISEGVIFRLIIGFTKRPSGQRIREAICYLRRAVPKSPSSAINLDFL